jgi:hypothetical protein
MTLDLPTDDGCPCHKGTNAKVVELSKQVDELKQGGA